jgi:adenosylcobinamide-phosphate synthase
MNTALILPFLLAAAADGYFADSLTGRFHPVIGIGWLIARLEKYLYPQQRDPRREFFAGLLVAGIIIAATWLSISILLAVASGLSWLLFEVVVFFLLYALLACGGLAREADRVLDTLEREGLEAGRRALAGIVGRETGRLQEADIQRAVIETVAENFSDGVIAPVCYLVLGGLPLAWAYKAVNTLDSMLGYKDSRYRHFGRFAARLDDFANLVPARLSALLILLAGCFLKLDWRAGWRILLRDRRAHASPNSGWPEAAMAGLLGVRLGGPNYYHGELVEKPYIGDDRNPVSDESARLAIRILYLGSGIGIILAVILTLLCSRG